MTLHKIGEPDPEPEAIESITIPPMPTEEEWNSLYGRWRLQCDNCQMSYSLKEWPGFGLEISLEYSFHLSSSGVNIWDKLLRGDAHFCSPGCASAYFSTVAKYAVHLEVSPDDDPTSN